MEVYVTYMGQPSEPITMTDTTIRVSEELADELYRRKGRTTSYEDYIWELLAEVDSDLDTSDDTTTAAARGRDEQFPDDPQDTGERIDLARKRVHELGLPGGDDLQQRREAAVLELYEELMSEPGEVVATTELKDTLEHTGAYSSVGSFWKNCVVGSSDRENALAALPGVDELGNGRYVYNPLEEENSG
jgi:hypothetical protein